MDFFANPIDFFACCSVDHTRSNLTYWIRAPFLCSLFRCERTVILPILINVGFPPLSSQLDSTVSMVKTVKVLTSTHTSTKRLRILHCVLSTKEHMKCYFKECRKDLDTSRKWMRPYCDHLFIKCMG